MDAKSACDWSNKAGLDYILANIAEHAKAGYKFVEYKDILSCAKADQFPKYVAIGSKKYGKFYSEYSLILNYVSLFEKNSNIPKLLRELGYKVELTEEIKKVDQVELVDFKYVKKSWFSSPEKVVETKTYPETFILKTYKVSWCCDDK